MTQTTEPDIRDLKISIDTLAKAVETIAKATEANTKANDTLSTRMETIAKATEANTLAISTLSTRVDAIAIATEANAKAIADLTLEMRVGFSDIKGEIKQVEIKLTGRIDTLEGKFDERTKGLSQRLDGKELAQRNIFTGLTVAIVGGLLLAFTKYLFFGVNP